MLSNQLKVTAVTALAPMVWGTTYLVTTQVLPPDRPLTAAALRALPAGLLILAFTRKWPHGAWWWKSMVLGTLNIGAFFALLFVAAYRLPGGVAATVGAVQPLVVGVLAARFLGEALTRQRLWAGAAGIVGVALLVLRSSSRLDAIGIAAALGGVLSMATGIVLAKKWGQPDRPLVTTSWQLVAGGLLLVPLALVVEGWPEEPFSATNLAGFGYLSLVGAALAYTAWFRGIQALPVGSITFLSLLSPVVAVLAGWAALGQALSAGQIAGTALILGAILVVTVKPATRVSSSRGRAGSTRPVGSNAGHRRGDGTAEVLASRQMRPPRRAAIAWCAKCMRGA